MKKNILILLLIMIYAFFLGILSSCEKENYAAPIQGTWKNTSNAYIFTDTKVAILGNNGSYYYTGTYSIGKKELELTIGTNKIEYFYKIVNNDTLYLITRTNIEYKYKRE